jgi:hypothetical protein
MCKLGWLSALYALLVILDSNETQQGSRPSILHTTDPISWFHHPCNNLCIHLVCILDFSVKTQKLKRIDPLLPPSFEQSVHSRYKMAALHSAALRAVAGTREISMI